VVANGEPKDDCVKQKKLFQLGE